MTHTKHKTWIFIFLLLLGMHQQTFSMQQHSKLIGLAAFCSCVLIGLKWVNGDFSGVGDKVVTIDLSGVDSIVVGGGINRLNFQQSNTASLSYDIQSNLMEYIDFTVQGSCLKIKLKEDCCIKTNKLITVCCALQKMCSLSASGSTEVWIGDITTDQLKVTCEDDSVIIMNNIVASNAMHVKSSDNGIIQVNNIRGNDLFIKTFDSGALTAALKVQNCSITSGDSGKTTLTGSVLGTLTAIVSDSSECYAPQLTSGTLRVSASDSGVVKVGKCSENFSATRYDSGKIYHDGTLFKR